MPCFAAARLDAALGHVGRQRVGRLVVGVVDAAGDDRPVGVAFQEIDDDFLADARQLDSAPGVAGPGGATRIQQELFSSFLPKRSQWNWTLTRPYSSVQISSPALPTTIAVWGPWTNGLGVSRGGR